MPIFKASRVSSDQNVLYPDIIEVNSANVVYYKGCVLGYTAMAIPRQNIASVSLSAGAFFVDVIVTSNGGTQIRARGFSKNKAREILEILL